MEIVLSPASRQMILPIAEQSQIAAARRAGAEIGRVLGLDETANGKMAIVITEAATNIFKHAGHGEILLRPLKGERGVGIEMIALDSGSGMSNLNHHMQDGVSTAGTYGVGLGAMRRMSDEFDVYTAPEQGTVVYAVVWNSGHEAVPPAWDIGVVCAALPSEDVCGDAWGIGLEPTIANIVVADGLGHGEDAAQASEAAVAVLEVNSSHPPGAMLQDMHYALRATRGAAVAVARIDTHSEQIVFAGVGNIAASVFDQERRRQMVSHNGIVGSNVRKVQEFTAEWSSASVLIMHSDGIGTRWDLMQFPGLSGCHPAVIAAVLYRDFSRKRDDATVLVMRENLGRAS